MISVKYNYKKVNLLCKHHRTANLITRAEIVRSSNCEITEKTIERYEKAGNSVPFSYICTLADIVGISVQNFIGPNGHDTRLDYFEEYKALKIPNADEAPPTTLGLHYVSDLTDTEFKILNILRRLPKNVFYAIEILLTFICELMENKSNKPKK